jgi:hypothetical protein
MPAVTPSPGRRAGPGPRRVSHFEREKGLARSGTRKGARSERGREGDLPPGVSGEAYSSRDIRRRSLPDFLDTTVATVVKPAFR